MTALCGIASHCEGLEVQGEWRDSKVWVFTCQCAMWHVGWRKDCVFHSFMGATKPFNLNKSGLLQRRSNVSCCVTVMCGLSNHFSFLSFEVPVFRQLMFYALTFWEHLAVCWMSFAQKKRQKMIMYLFKPFKSLSTGNIKLRVFLFVELTEMQNGDLAVVGFSARFFWCSISYWPEGTCTVVWRPR